MSLTVEWLVLYPVKGLRGLAVPEAVLEPCGLRGDRRWAVMRPDGKVLTQRDVAHMARIDARPEAAGVRLEAAGFGGVTARAAEQRGAIDVWRTQVPVRLADAAASAWLSRVLGTACLLVHQDGPASRALTPDLARPGDVVSLADGFPLLVTSTASLADLNGRMAACVPMGRFRPNLVVHGAPAWAEDRWTAIKGAAIEGQSWRLRLASPCSRCTVTTIDQSTGARPQRTEPLHTLGTFHRDGAGRVTFGWNAVPEQLGAIRVNEPLLASLQQ